ncbi:hypothetical protein I4658_01000 [Proteus mirabilis]|nr:hypothetical protein [Proteus mirabilis]HEJ0301539.1 hypothetical protein [Proteus mirabilis]
MAFFIGWDMKNNDNLENDTDIAIGLIPVSDNGRITAFTSDGKPIRGLVCCNVDSDHGDLVRMTLTVEVTNRDGKLAICNFKKDEFEEIRANFLMK